MISCPRSFSVNHARLHAHSALFLGRCIFSFFPLRNPTGSFPPLPYALHSINTHLKFVCFPSSFSTQKTYHHYYSLNFLSLIAMRFIPFIVGSLFATAAYAQNVFVTAPSNGVSLSPGSNFTVDVERPNSLSGSEEVAVVIALQSCATRACLPPSEWLGTILYNGNFSPVEPNPNPMHQQPNQNFTVQIPPSFQNGSALLSVTHVALIGAGYNPYMEFHNVSMNITN
ncbi:hypothetical protein SERLA73DRAFT_187013 [Serpula lacrymans var. lacrymans S7.3]|uniref:Uncharacterized protein n=2 Tax=Serpula lacrymans var. lacrymans TaxID=341189 RepID=F8Q8A4_SERL3|nr:uncharacterized protein SERLADRAFT_476341 [Serpula lacrymans var. lacrymans S7.9]EGN95792.1 hypothetical protein SERLA73DRAFT_187013 [Serpula lacrymans var. lacrymans S7.3]EGO21313.1 hypothetical protein SERLADRAFT_476341 [Serpula lacrymans var. lacrymans S7.9]